MERLQNSADMEMNSESFIFSDPSDQEQSACKSAVTRLPVDLRWNSLYGDAYEEYGVTLQLNEASHEV